MRWCDRHGVDYILGLAKNSILLAKAQPWMRQAQEPFEAKRQKQRLFGEIAYAAQTWDKPRRVIVKAEHAEGGESPRFVTASLAGDPQALYDDLYCQRGDAENRIKEQQLGLFAPGRPCATWTCHHPPRHRPARKREICGLGLCHP